MIISTKVSKELDKLTKEFDFESFPKPLKVPKIPKRYRKKITQLKRTMTRMSGQNNSVKRPKRGRKGKKGKETNDVFHNFKVNQKCVDCGIIFRRLNNLIHQQWCIKCKKIRRKQQFRQNYYKHKIYKPKVKKFICKKCNRKFIKSIYTKVLLCPMCKLDYNRRYYRKKYYANISYFKNYYCKNKERISKRCSEYNKLHKDDINARQKKYYFLKKTDKNKWLRYKIDHNISETIRLSLNGRKKGISWEKLVGYNLTSLIKHLEAKFKKGMNWDNYGKIWHIDHILPKSNFKYQDYTDKEFKECWKLSNLQPLFAIENIKKGNKIYVVSKKTEQI